MHKKILYATLLLSFNSLFSQVVINEASNKNASQIQNSEGKYKDWIEIYSSDPAIDLHSYYLSDSRKNLLKWPFPEGATGNTYTMVFADNSDAEDGELSAENWETAVFEDDVWSYVIPDATTATDWMNSNYDDSGWMTGQGGFGFGDDDDATTIDETSVAVYTRMRFSVSDISTIIGAILHVDYDDGFVAYLNGVEIARSNIDGTPVWNTTASDMQEALMYHGQLPVEFLLDAAIVQSLLQIGDNVLAIEVHNVSNSSSDMSLRTFLSFNLSEASTQFRSVPYWFPYQNNNQGTEGFHTNFKLSSKGETIYLSNSDSQILDSLVIPKDLPVDCSVGALTDGAKEKGIYVNATPNASNNSQTVYTKGIEKSPVFSLKAGIYPGTQQVIIAAVQGTPQIRYTTDGSEPTNTSSLYTNPVSITKSTVLKAICIGANGVLSSIPTTATYIIESNPTNAGILSVVTDNENLWGGNGIFTNFYSEDKIPCYIEYFAPENHQLVFSQRSGMKTDGGAGGSRSNDQHSFRLEPSHGVFGDGDIDYQLIPSVDRDSYETFYLRNGSNQYLYYPCKDAIETTVLGKGTYNYYSGYTPVNVYINGEYFGYYELREKLDADFFKKHYDVDKDNLELLSLSYYYNSVLRSVEGDSAVEHFNEDYAKYLSLNTSYDSFIADADSLFDMTYYTDYICAQSWIANVDWPFNNIKIFRAPETKNKWRFGLIDVEWALFPNGWSSSSDDFFSYLINYDPNVMYHHIWQKAVENEEYRNYFINRFADLMNTVWLPEKTKTIADEIYEETRPELSRTFTRWGSGYLQQTDDAHSQMLSEFENRSNYVRTHIVSNFTLNKQVSITLNVNPQNAGIIKISTIIPTEYPWTGVYFDGVPVKIEAIPYAGYNFDSWSENTIVSQLSNSVFEGNISKNTTFTANFTATARPNTVVFSEINYNSLSAFDTGDWIELWNVDNSMPVNLTGWYITDQQFGTDEDNRFYFPANTSIAPNKRLVITKNSMKFSQFNPDVSHLGDMTFNFSNDEGSIFLFNQENKLVTMVAYSDILPWPLGADGQGYTLELINPNASMISASNWGIGCIGGSPGVAPVGNCIPKIPDPLIDNSVPSVEHLIVYPNPVSHTLFVYSQGSDNIQYTYSISDCSGRHLLTGNVEGKGLINVNDLPKGIYFIQFIGNQGVNLFKIIKTE